MTKTARQNSAAGITEWHCESCGKDFTGSLGKVIQHENTHHGGAQTCWQRPKDRS